MSAEQRSTAPLTRVPRVAIFGAVLAIGLLLAPIAGLLLRTPWDRLGALLTNEASLTALRLSLVVSISALAIVVVLGFPLAWFLAYTDFPGQRIVRAFILLPMVLPPVVGGTALLFALGRRGFIGQLLDRWFGIELLGTTSAAIIAAAFVALPFFVSTVESALRETSANLDEAAATLGASPGYIMRRITLPQITSSLLAGVALSWARALGEFGATVTFAGNRSGQTRTLPLEIFLALEADPDAALALSLILMLVSLAILTVTRDRWMPR